MSGDAARVVVASKTAVLRSDVFRDEATRVSASPETADDIARRNAVSVDIRGFVRFASSRIPVAFADSGSVHKASCDHGAFWKALFV